MKRFIVIFACFLLFFAMPVFAVDSSSSSTQWQPVPEAQGLFGMKKTADEGGIPNISDDDAAISHFIGKIIKIALGFVATIFFILVVYAGFLWMTSGGSADGATNAKKIMTNAIIGLVIIVASYAIVTFVFDSLA